MFVSIVFLNNSKCNLAILMDVSNFGTKQKIEGTKKQRTYLSADKISRIIQTFNSAQEVDDFSVVVLLDDIEKKNFSFSAMQFFNVNFGIIKNQPPNFLLSTSFTVIDVNPEKVDANFLYYQISRDKITNFLQSIAEQSTTAYPSIKSYDIENLEIELPLLVTQKRIGAFFILWIKKFLSTKKINSTLEEMARTIYLHKFFRKAANGRIGDLILENPNSTISVNAGIKFYVGLASYSTHTWSITENGAADYLYLLLDSIKSEIDKRFFTGTG